jgi:hypothetical protein
VDATHASTPPSTHDVAFAPASGGRFFDGAGFGIGFDFVG